MSAPGWIWYVAALFFILKMHLAGETVSNEMGFVICLICAQLWGAWSINWRRKR